MGRFEQFECHNALARAPLYFEGLTDHNPAASHAKENMCKEELTPVSTIRRRDLPIE
jgi:hypothetical protein